MAQPLLARLHEKSPGLRIDVLAPEWVAPVMRRMPEVDDVSNDVEYLLGDGGRNISGSVLTIDAGATA